MNDVSSTCSTPGLALTDGAIALRPWHMDDVEALYLAARESIESVGRWLPWCHSGYRREDAVQWIEHCEISRQTGARHAFAIWAVATSELVGGVGLSAIDEQRHVANLGYWVRHRRQGHGLAAAAARLLLPFGFEALGLQRIEIRASIHNRASRRTAEAVGARFDGIVADALPVAGSNHDAVIYSLSAPGR